MIREIGRKPPRAIMLTKFIHELKSGQNDLFVAGSVKMFKRICAQGTNLKVVNTP